MVHDFIGGITLRTDRAALAGPYDLSLRFRAQFGADGHWQVAEQDFGDGGEVEIDDIDIGFGGPRTLIIALKETARGEYDRVNGRALLRASLGFRLGLLRSSLSLDLDTACHELAPGTAQECGALWTSGAQPLCLAGIGTFVTGPLNGTRCLAVLRGQFKPAPW